MWPTNINDLSNSLLVFKQQTKYLISAIQFRHKRFHLNLIDVASKKYRGKQIKFSLICFMCSDEESIMGKCLLPPVVLFPCSITYSKNVCVVILSITFHMNDLKCIILGKNNIELKFVSFVKRDSLHIKDYYELTDVSYNYSIEGFRRKWNYFKFSIVLISYSANVLGHCFNL